MTRKELDGGGDGGCGHVLRIALPLIVAQASSTIMFFVDRIFLARYSSNAMAGAMFAGLAGWTSMSLFMGTAGYTGTFVAQYYGAGRQERISPAIWHGVYFALLSGVVLLAVAFFAEHLMGLAGHAPAARAEEVTYFRIFVAGGGLMVLSGTLASFYGGLGKTYYSMAIHIPGHALNVFLNYCLIFGRFGFPRWGTRGAATATVISTGFILLTFVVVLLYGRLGRSFQILRKPRFEKELFGRLLRYGLPNGAHWTVDMVGWTAFVMFLYRLGETAQQGASVAFSINHLAFLPMMGFGTATSILVGQFIGAGRPALAERASFSAFKMTLAYMVSIAAVFVLLPGPLVRLFRPEKVGENWPAAYALAVVFLRFVAVYSIFDAVNIVYSSALRGAGDTRFVMVMIAVLSLSCLVLPAYLVVHVFKMGFYAVATVGTVYVALMAAAFYLRYRGGRWKTMRVIEAAGPAAAADSVSPQQ